MPSPHCCYCGARILAGRRLIKASPEVLQAAAAYRVSNGLVPRTDCQFVCTTHARHTPVTRADDAEVLTAAKDVNNIEVSKEVCMSSN